MRVMTWTLVAVAGLAVATGGYLYWEHARHYPSTDDAFVDAHVVRVAAQVSGRVDRVFVHDQQDVAEDAPLFSLDPRPFELAVDRDRAELGIVRETLQAQAAAVRAAGAAVRERKVLLANLRERARRLRSLLKRRYASIQEVEDADAAVRGSRAQLSLAGSRMHQARATLGAGGARNARLRAAAAALAQARVELGYARVTAPCTGKIAALSLRPGDVVSPGVPLFALICNQEWWVNANYKETKLERIRAGQPATVHVDMYPGHPFHGRVEHIGGASGVAFSLLPPQNATGNWVKVTQRVPVRVRITDPDPRLPLRVGTSAEVTIDTTVSDPPQPGVR